MNRADLEEAIRACEELIQRIKGHDHAAVDTARHMLWQWVDQGNQTELLNLTCAVKESVSTVVDHLQAGNGLEEAKKMLWEFTNKATEDGLVKLLDAMKLLTIKAIKNLEEP